VGPLSSFFEPTAETLFAFDLLDTSGFAGESSESFKAPPNFCHRSHVGGGLYRFAGGLFLGLSVSTAEAVTLNFDAFFTLVFSEVVEDASEVIGVTPAVIRVAPEVSGA